MPAPGQPLHRWVAATAYRRDWDVRNSQRRPRRACRRTMSTHGTAAQRQSMLGLYVFSPEGPEMAPCRYCSPRSGRRLKDLQRLLDLFIVHHDGRSHYKVNSTRGHVGIDRILLNRSAPTGREVLGVFHSSGNKGLHRLFPGRKCSITIRRCYWYEVTHRQRVMNPHSTSCPLT